MVNKTVTSMFSVFSASALRGRRAGLGLFPCLALAGCGPGQAAAPASQTPGAGAGGPVTVQNCGQAVTYTKVPQRVVVNDDALIATMFALGLEDRIVGIAGVDQVQVLQQKYPEAMRKARVLSKDYITKEVLLGANPDFVFAGYGYGFSQEKGVTPESLKALGIATYQLTEACLQEGQGGARGGADPLSSLYLDMTNLGKIFGIEARAEQLVASYKARVQAAQRSLPPGKPPVSVFFYDSGTDAPLTSGAYAVPNDLIKLAGGRNVFDDVKDSWTTVTWEEVVKRDPAFILIADYGETTAEQKIRFARTSPVLAQVPAVTGNRFLTLPLPYLTPSPLNVDAVEQIAQALRAVP